MRTDAARQFRTHVDNCGCQSVVDFSLSDAAIMSSGLDIALNAVAGLQPCVAMLKYLWDEIEKIETNRNKCQSLIRRAARVPTAINEALEKYPNQCDDTDERLRKLKRFVYFDHATIGILSVSSRRSNVEFLATLVRNLASMSLLNSLLARDNIAMRLEEAHARLSDSLVAFQVLLSILPSNPS
jgi:hypothetical protein